MERVEKHNRNKGGSPLISNIHFLSACFSLDEPADFIPQSI